MLRGGMTPCILIQEGRHISLECSAGRRVQASREGTGLQDGIEEDLPCGDGHKGTDAGNATIPYGWWHHELFCIPLDHRHEHHLRPGIETGPKRNLRDVMVFCNSVKAPPQENIPVHPGCNFSSLPDYFIHCYAKHMSERYSDVTSPKSICSGWIPNAWRPLIDGDGKELKIPAVSSKPSEEIQESLPTPASEENADPVSGDNPSVASYCTFCLCLEIENKMVFAEVEARITLVHDSAPAAGAAGYFWHADQPLSPA